MLGGNYILVVKILKILICHSLKKQLYFMFHKTFNVKNFYVFFFFFNYNLGIKNAHKEKKIYLFKCQLCINTIHKELSQSMMNNVF